MAENQFESGVKYLQFQSVVDHTFWHKLCQLKLDVDKLEENERPIWALFVHPQVCSLYVDYMSFNREVDWKLYSGQFTTLRWLCSAESKCNYPLVSMRGSINNFNTSQAFKNSDKNQVLLCCGETIATDITSGRAVDDPTLLSRFVLLTYADLKKYDFYYWFAFPASLSVQASYVSQPQKLRDVIPESQLGGVWSSHEELSREQRTVFGVQVGVDGSARCISLRQLITYLTAGGEEERNACYLCYLDPSNDVKHPGWPLRNILALIAFHWKDVERIPLKVMSFRVGPHFLDSPVFHISVKVTDDGEMKKWVGWERNARDKLGPRFTSLKETMDPARLAESSAELNLKLMKWRLAPTLDLEVVASQRVLILGAGTLGCALARNLLCWGVRRMTFVDYGSVSYSNPVRQCLYTHSDCLKEKATAAAAALKLILPSVECSGLVLEIPMPGHSTASVANATKLHELIESHDAVFLVTDSRESRWLPTLIAASLSKICFTAALGFDTYLVMRHGHRLETGGGGGDGQGGGDDDCGLQQEQQQRLGCYFCNDVTAPGDSSVDRTLDQQCTVSRPAVSSMAAALAAELYVSLLQQPPPTDTTKVTGGESESTTGCSSSASGGGGTSSRESCCLGQLPHSIRGFLSSYSHLLLSTPAFSKCIACSSQVVDLYRREREQFLLRVFESNTYLEQVTGLSELHRLTEQIQDFSLSEEESD